MIRFERDKEALQDGDRLGPVQSMQVDEGLLSLARSELSGTGGGGGCDPEETAEPVADAFALSGSIERVG